MAGRRGTNRSIPLFLILGAAFVTGYGFGWARLRSVRGEADDAGGMEESEDVPAEPPKTPVLALE